MWLVPGNVWILLWVSCTDAERLLVLGSCHRTYLTGYLPPKPPAVMVLSFAVLRRLPSCLPACLPEYLPACPPRPHLLLLVSLQVASMLPFAYMEVCTMMVQG